MWYASWQFLLHLHKKSLCYWYYIEKLRKPQHCFPPYFSFCELCILFRHLCFVSNTKTEKERNPHFRYTKELNRVLMFSNIVSTFALFMYIPAAGKGEEVRVKHGETWSRHNPIKGLLDWFFLPANNWKGAEAEKVLKIWKITREYLISLYK